MKKFFTIFTLLFATIFLSFYTVACRSVDLDKRPIIVVTREEGSGTRDAVMEFFTGDKATPVPNDSITANSTNFMLTKVASDPGAIGYDSAGTVIRAKNSGVKVVSLKLENVEISKTTIENGEYKLQRNLTLIYRKDISNDRIYKNSHVANKFLEFVTSSNVIDPVVADYFQYQQNNTIPYVVEPNLSGEVVVVGSTSLAPLMLRIQALYESVQPNVRINLTSSGSSAGRDGIKNDTADFGMISADLTAKQEEDILNGQSDTEIGKTIVAIDAIAIIVNEKNKYDNITIEQLNKIYNGTIEGYATWGDAYGDTKQ